MQHCSFGSKVNLLARLFKPLLQATWNCQLFFKMIT